MPGNAEVSIVETNVAQHYDTGAMLERIKNGLRAAGADPDRPDPAALKPVDEFHVGGIEATEALLTPLAITSRTRVLDIGSGIGGTARHIATRHGARVIGIDLTPAFVETANALSAMCGLDGHTEYRVASAYDLPVDSHSVDLATMIHVGMNLEDKFSLFREVARVLAPGGRFAVFDYMQITGEDPEFPVPWASSADHSFVDHPETYRRAAARAGLGLVHERDRHDYAVGFFKKVIAATEENGPPHVGLHLIMGDEAQTRYGNVVKASFDGKVGPREMVFRK